MGANKTQELRNSRNQKPIGIHVLKQSGIQDLKNSKLKKLKNLKDYEWMKNGKKIKGLSYSVTQELRNPLLTEEKRKCIRCQK